MRDSADVRWVNQCTTSNCKIRNFNCFYVLNFNFSTFVCLYQFYRINWKCNNNIRIKFKCVSEWPYRRAPSTCEVSLDYSLFTCTVSCFVAPGWKCAVKSVSRWMCSRRDICDLVLKRYSANIEIWWNQSGRRPTRTRRYLATNSSYRTMPTSYHALPWWLLSGSWPRWDHMLKFDILEKTFSLLKCIISKGTLKYYFWYVKNFRIDSYTLFLSQGIF